eukprot:TRINITY_DN30386_c0_g1_i1.p1 TRINITY_DN30386_c0_g1~~TRINITY_DN30386_c0_g1_i1.p1  ORF type:complete len:447 (+),score=63.62 TRINITY_DN30386_c0_g1_i1:348-1688(+)
MYAQAAESDGQSGGGSVASASVDGAGQRRWPHSSSNGRGSIVLRGGHPCPPRLVERWRSQSLCDVEVVTEGGHRHMAHRVVLAAGSDYMSALFDAGMADSIVPTIHLPDVSSTAFGSVLEFVYAGECSLTDEESLMDVVEAAGRLQVNHLLIVGSNELETRLVPDSCLVIWKFSDRLALLNLRAAAKREALLSFERLLETPAFCALSWSNLSELLTDEHLTVSREERVFDAVKRWVGAQNSPPSQNELLPLLKQIRFPLMAETYISQHVRPDPIFATSAALEVLLDAFQRDYYRRSKAVTGERNPAQSRRAVGFVLQAKDRDVVITGISTYFQQHSTHCQLVVFHRPGSHENAGLLNFDLASDPAWTSMPLKMSYSADSLSRWPLDLRVSIPAEQAHTFIARVVPAFMDRSDISIVSQVSPVLVFDGLQLTRIGTGTVAGTIDYTL